MGGPVSMVQALETYCKIYVRPEWQETAQTVLTQLSSQIASLPQNADAIDLDPNWVDGFLVSLTDGGQDLDEALAVLADALEFLCSRRVLTANPLAPAANGLTTRLSRNVPVANVAEQIVAAPSLPPNLSRVNYRTLREALDYLFPIDQTLGMRRRVGYSESTLNDTYLPKWQKLFGFLEKRGVKEVRKVSQSDLKAFIDSLPKKMKPQTRNGYIHAFRAFWRELVDDGAVSEADNPAAVRVFKVREKDKEVRTPLSIEEIASLLSYIDGIEDEFEKRSLRALFLAEAFGGPRVFEVVAIAFEDVDWVNGTVRIRKGKGGAERHTILIQAALDDLRWLMNHRSAYGQAPLLVNLPRGRGKAMQEQRITKNTAWRWLSSLGKEVGVHLYNHRLRHTAGSLAEQFGSPAYRRSIGIPSAKGRPDVLSMVLLGHSSAAVNAGYNKVKLRAVREVMEEVYQHIRILSGGLSANRQTDVSSMVA